MYTHLKNFDPHTRRKIFTTMHDVYTTRAPPAAGAGRSPKSPPLTLENNATLGPSLVLSAVQSINTRGRVGRDEEGWCVDRVWLELQLVLDEWGTVEPSAHSQGVRILLSHFAQNNNWTMHPVFSRLLRRMGTEFQVDPPLLTCNPCYLFHQPSPTRRPLSSCSHYFADAPDSSNGGYFRTAVQRVVAATASLAGGPRTGPGPTLDASERVSRTREGEGGMSSTSILTHKRRRTREEKKK